MMSITSELVHNIGIYDQGGRPVAGQLNLIGIGVVYLHFSSSRVLGGGVHCLIERRLMLLCTKAKWLW